MRDSVLHVTPEDIYAIPIGKRWMLFSPKNMTGAMVNRAAVEAVAACAEFDEADVHETVKDLWLKMLEVTETLRCPPAAQDKLVIIPTRACNMHCVYCDFGITGQNASTLDPDLACRLIADAAEKLSSKSSTILRVHFFGGEPLVARPCVETVVHYARMLCSRKGLAPWFEITTNGLFDTTAVPFIGDYLDSAVISIDGNKSMHDFNRRRTDGSGTYCTIAANIRRLSQFPLELSLRTCVTSRSVDAMTSITSHFCSEFEFDLLCFEMMVPNGSSHRVGLDPPDPYRFAAGVLEAETLAASHGVRVVHGPAELIGPRASSCPVGRDSLMLTPEGILSACYLEIERWTSRGLDPVIGRVNPVSGPVVEQHKLDAITSLLDAKPRCARCFCRHTCAGGCHIDQTPPGCSLEYDDRCRAIRIITAGRLLRDLEGTPALESFTGQLSSMRAVAENPDDRLAVWTSSAIRREQ